jgi:hypothetical protein
VEEATFHDFVPTDFIRYSFCYISTANCCVGCEVLNFNSRKSRELTQLTDEENAKEWKVHFFQKAPLSKRQGRQFPDNTHKDRAG